MLRQIPEDSMSILEQACGTGILTTKIARRFPLSLVTGVDVEREYLQVARKKMLALGLTNIQFIAGRAEDVLLDTRFDCIISSYLAKYADLPTLVAGAANMLKEGGILIMHDFAYPRIAAFALVWRLNFLLLRGAGGRLFPEWKPAFSGLPDLLRQTTWITDLASLLGKNGFSEIGVESLTFGSAAIVTARRQATPD